MASQILLDHGLVTCVASDAHGAYRRTTFMGDIKEFLEEEYGKRYANRLLLHNPESIISDIPISNDSIIRPEAREWFPY